MKKYFLNLFGLALAASCLWSCDDVVNIPATDRITQEAIWSGNTKTLDQYVIGLYGAVRDKSTLYGYTTQFTDCLTDLMKDGDWIADRRYNRKVLNYEPFTSDDASILSTWSDSYTRVRRFNEFLRDVNEFGSRYDSDYLKVRVAEVRLMRAMQYFYLIRVYGGVVIRDKYEGPEANDKERLSEADSWAWVMQEIEDVAGDLPVAWDASNFTRLTQVAAYGFLSRVALYAGAWEKAVQAAETCERLGASLAPTYADVFANRKSPENLIIVDFASTGLSNSADVIFRPAGDSPKHASRTFGSPIVPTAEFADAFEMADGSPFSWEEYKAHPDRWNNDPYAGREPRFYSTILYNNASWEDRTIESYAGGVDGIQLFVREGFRTATCTGYYYRKYITENDHSWDTAGSGHYDILLRFGEVLLNKAEAQAQGGNVPEALKTLNRVRQRAGLPDASASTLAAFMEVLEHERIVELGGENFRFWDLRRWQLGVQRLNNVSFHGVMITKDPTGAFAYAPCDIDDGAKRVFMDRYYHFALPSGELNNNKALNNENNPGW